MSSRRKVSEYSGTRTATLVNSVSDPAAVAAIGSLMQTVEYQRREIANLTKEVRDTRVQLQNLSTAVNAGYLEMSNNFQRMCVTISQNCNVVGTGATNQVQVTTTNNTAAALNIDIPLPETEVEVNVNDATFANNQPNILPQATVANNTPPTPADLARAAGIDATTRLRASNDPHLPVMATVFPTTWAQLLAEWRREHLSSLERKGVPATWNDSKLQQRYAKRVRCIRVIRRIAAREEIPEEEVEQELDSVLRAVSQLRLSQQLADLEKVDPEMKRRQRKD
jgi:hypothetical protein